MVKFTFGERKIVQSIIALLSIRRIPDNQIAKEVEKQTGKTITRQGIAKIRERIKKESYEWYRKLRQNEYEYIYEYNQRIQEIIYLQTVHNKIVHNRKTRPEIRQQSLAELHKLTKTLAELHDVAPDIVSNFKDDGKQDNDIISKKRKKKQTAEPIV